MKKINLPPPLGGQGSFDDLFSDLPELDAFDVKKIRFGADLAALAAHCKKTRSVLAKELGWSKSRISKVMSGEGNLTLRTVWEVAAKLEHDFVLVFQSKRAPSPAQPWERISGACTEYIPYSSPPLVTFRVQTKEEVKQDIQTGCESDIYISAVPSKNIAPEVFVIEATPSNILFNTYLPGEANYASSPIKVFTSKVPA